MEWRTYGAALALALAVGVPAPATAAPAPPDLAALQAALDGATARATALADALEQARAADGGLRRAVEDLQEAHDAAQRRLEARVRQVYMASPPDVLSGWTALTDPGSDVLAVRGRAGAVRVEQDLVDAVSEESAGARALRAQAERFRAGLQAQAAQVLAEQEQARVLLEEATAVVAEQQRVAAARQAQEQADAAARAAQQLDASRRALDAVSSTLTAALAPAVTDRGRRAQAAEEPVLRLLEAAGSSYPVGYAPTGAVVRGTASWYGPGFVGSPTASGRPYDPERLTCAHKTLPLGTVLHVMANGRAVNCLVDDRGPHVGDRVLDLSRAGSRALGYDGTAQVVAEVLAAP